MYNMYIFKLGQKQLNILLKVCVYNLCAMKDEIGKEKFIVIIVKYFLLSKRNQPFIY